MAQGVRDDWAEDGGIDHHHGAGDPCEAAGHQGKEFATLQARQPGADEQRGLDHADEDMRGGAEAQGSADAQGAAEDPGEGA